MCNANYVPNMSFQKEHLGPFRFLHDYPDSKVHGAKMGPNWVLSAPDGPHVGPMNFAIRVILSENDIIWSLVLLHIFHGFYNFLHWHTPHTILYANGFIGSAFLCLYCCCWWIHILDFPIFFRVASLILGQSHYCIRFPVPVNSSPPSAAWMHQWIRSALVQIMAYCLFCVKP